MSIRTYSSNGLRSGLVAALAGGLLFCSTAHAQLATTTTLSVSPNAPQFGQPVTLTATVTPYNAPGTVLFLDGVTPVAAAAVNPSGQAQATTILLPAGKNFLQAVYSGSPGSYQPSQSATLPYIVTPISGAGFLNAVNYSSGRFTYSVAVGDFNGDRKADLVVANANSGNVNVLLGNGNGTFQAPVAYLVGQFPAFVVVEDFNGDGKPDLAVANYSSNDVSVLLGNGDGTFQPTVNYPAGTDPWSAAVGDFNGDGIADLVVANNGSSNVSVLLGNGDGTFQAALNYLVASALSSVAVGDFNGDGKADLAVTNYVNNNVSILLGNGNGTFQAAVNYPVGNPFSVVVGDFNGDGRADLAVANDAGNNVSVLLGNGNGTFQTALSYPVGANPFSVAVGDFNGDGKPDLVAANTGSSNVSVLLGNGNGTFQAAVNYAAGSGPYSVAVGDFNGDGRADLAVANYNGSNVSVLLATTTTPPSTSTVLTSSPNPSRYGQAVTLTAQVNPPNTTGNVEFLDGTTVLGSGVLSVSGQAQYVTSGLPSGTGSLRAVYGGVPGVWQPSQSAVVSQVVNAVPGSSFAVSVNYAAGTTPDSVAVGDFNGDGKADLAVANYGSGDVSVLLGNGNGTFQAAVNYAAGSGPGSVAVGDFNGDGKADLAVANYGSGNVSVLLGNGDGTFQAAMNYAVGPHPRSMVVGDFNGDGKPDLAMANPGSNNVGVLLGNGNGTFQAVVNYPVGGNPNSVAVRDFNGDGKADLAVANGLSSDFLSSGPVSVLLGNGNGTLQAALNSAAGTALGSVVVGDFNGDGKLDLAGVVNNKVGVLLGNGDGTFQAAVNYAAGGSPSSVAVGDFNGDGIADLAVADSYGTVSVLLGGPLITAVSVTPNSGSGAGPQVFRVVYSDTAGASDLQVMYLDFGSVGDAAHDCKVAFAQGTNALFLFNDANTAALGPITLGGGGSLSNSQCTLFGGATAATPSGNNLTVPFTIQFLDGYGGPKNIFGVAQSYSGVQSANGALQKLGTWTPAASTPGVVSVSPNSGSGAGPQVFTAVYSDTGGANDLQAVYLNFGSVGFAAQNCIAVYVPGPNTLYLFTDDNSNAVGPIAEGAGGGSISNSQCTLTSGATPATLSGTNLTVPFNITFKPGYGGKKTIFGLAQTYAALQSNGGVLTSLGSWEPALTTLGAVSVSPSSGSGFGPTTFTATYSDTGGANDLQVVYLSFGASFLAANSCNVGYQPGNNQLLLFSDDNSTAATVGENGAGSVSNSQCTLSGGNTAAVISGTGATVPFTITFKAGFTGTKNVFGLAQSYDGTQSAITLLGSWTP